MSEKSMPTTTKDMPNPISSTSKSGPLFRDIPRQREKITQIKKEGKINR